jgi:hypothetical protein
MRMSWAILISLGMSAASFADEVPDYIRFVEDSTSSRLEIAIKTFTMRSGQRVDLIGALHIADLAYYEQLNERFDHYDAVLFELVGDPSALTSNAPGPDRKLDREGGGAIGFIQQAAAEHLKLTFQLEAIDYTKKNMIHADVSAEEFAAMQKQRGETTITLFARALQAQMNGGISPDATADLDTFGLIRILMSPDSATAFKKALAKMFDQMETMTAAMEGKDGSVILSGRNGLAVKKVKEVLANRKRRHIAVFYGGAHMPGIESALINDLGAKASGEEWLAAWTMPK